MFRREKTVTRAWPDDAEHRRLLAAPRDDLVAEEEHIDADQYKIYGDYDDTTGGRVYGGRLAIMWSGSGVKFWLKNTIGGVALFTETALALGVKIGAASGGGKWGRYSTGTTDVTAPFAVVTAYTGTPGAGDNYLEAVVL